MHVVNDALFVGLNPLLPLIAIDLGLTYTQVGAIKAAFSGASAAFQVPAGFAAERWGEQILLSLGTGWVGLGLAAMGLSTAFWMVVAIGAFGGLGGNIQHPVATGIISRVYDGPRRASAIGTLNFAGDIGKVIAPVIVGVVAAYADWRTALLVLGTIGLLFAIGYGLTMPEPDRAARPSQHVTETGTTDGWGIRRWDLFLILILVGVLDAAARGAALTFVPFVLADKGMDIAGLSVYLTILFAAGAAGKFLCGPLADRFGNVAAIVVTELLTAGALIGLLNAPTYLVVLTLIPLGFALNGTSSVLYATVATLVDPHRRARGYGVYFTCTLLSSALAPIAYGALADATNLGFAVSILAAITALIAPLVLIVRVEGRPT